MSAPIFKRILLKISGEALAATQGFGIDTKRIHEVAAELADVHNLGIQMAIVVGGAISFVALPTRLKIWIVFPPITWACWRP
jgi:uridylate kinase